MSKTTEPLLPLDPAQPTYGYRPASGNQPPAVSVITPYFNTGPLFLETARSLLRQSLQNWEWVIVNDGTTEADALRVLLPFRSADRRIQVIDQPNRGLPAARNAGVGNTSAPLLFFLDSDDLLQPTALEKMAWSLESRPGSAFTTSWQRSFGQTNVLWPRGFDTRYAFLYECMISPTVMMRRTAFEAVGEFDETRRWLEDYELWLRSAAHGLWGHDIHEYLIAIRVKAREEYRGYAWPDRDRSRRLNDFRAEMRGRYPKLFRQGLPRPARPNNGLFDTYTPIPTDQPFGNTLNTGTSKRRVLLILPWMRVGGADRWAIDLAQGLAKRGDRVSVALARDDVAHDWLEQLQRHTSDVFDLGAFLERADFPRFLQYLIESRSITHVLISNSLLGYRLLPFLRATCPHVATLDFQHMEEAWRAGGFPRTSIEYADMLDLQIANSAHLRGWMLDRGADATRIEVCTVNTDTTYWQNSVARHAQARAAFKIPNDTPVIAIVARLVPQKRPRFAAEVLRQLRDNETPFLALVAGDGEDMAWMRRFVRRYKLEAQIRLLGARSTEGVREVLASADLLLLPSENEALALVVQEAMAMGVVPVASNVGGMSELVTPETGILVAPGPHETEQYIQALRALLADSTKRTAMAEAGRQRMLAHFDLGSMIDRTQQLLDQAATNHSHAPRPTVSPGIGFAAASLAIEHEQLEHRLRGLPPVRALLSLRRSSAWRGLPNLAKLRATVERTDRVVYRARRMLMQRLRKT